MLAMGTIGYSLAVYGDPCRYCRKEHDGDCPKILAMTNPTKTSYDIKRKSELFERATREYEKGRKKHLQVFEDFIAEYCTDDVLDKCEEYLEKTMHELGGEWTNSRRVHKCTESDRCIARLIEGFRSPEDCVYAECILKKYAHEYGIEFEPCMPEKYKPLADKIMAEELSKGEDPFEEEDDDDETDEETSHEAAITHLVQYIGESTSTCHDFIGFVEFELDICAHRHHFLWGSDLAYVKKDRAFWHLIDIIQREIRTTNDAVWIYGEIIAKHKFGVYGYAFSRKSDNLIEKLSQKDDRPVSLSEDVQTAIRQGIGDTTFVQANFILTMMGEMACLSDFHFFKHNRLDCEKVDFDILNRIRELVRTQRDAVRIANEGLRAFSEAKKLTYFEPKLPPSYKQDPKVQVRELCEAIRCGANSYERACVVQTWIWRSSKRNYFQWKLNEWPKSYPKDLLWDIAMKDRIMSCIDTYEKALLVDEALGKAAEFFGYKWETQPKAAEEKGK